jgi:hypothetical protein
MRWALLAAQRFDGFDFSRAASRQVGSHRGRAEQNARDGGECDRVAGTDLKQQGLDDNGERQRAGKADGYSQYSEPETLAKYHG